MQRANRIGAIFKGARLDRHCAPANARRRGRRPQGDAAFWAFEPRLNRASTEPVDRIELAAIWLNLARGLPPRRSAHSRRKTSWSSRRRGADYSTRKAACPPRALDFLEQHRIGVGRPRLGCIDGDPHLHPAALDPQRKLSGEDATLQSVRGRYGQRERTSDRMIRRPFGQSSTRSIIVPDPRLTE